MSLGVKYESETDFDGFAAHGFSLARTYRSDTGRWQWRHEFFGIDTTQPIPVEACISLIGAISKKKHCFKVIQATDTYGFALYRQDGRLIQFSGSSSYDAPPNINLRVRRLVDAGGATTGFDVTLPDGMFERYDPAGRLSSITLKDGKRSTLTYSTASDRQLAAVADSFGRSLVFSYNSSSTSPGHVAIVTDPSGYVTSYAYDSDSNLAAITHPDGAVRTYQYNEQVYTGSANLPNALTGITDENGTRYAIYRYDSTGRAVSTEHAAGHDNFQLAYTSQYAQTNVTDPLGTQRTYNFQTILGVVKNTGQSQPGGSGCGPSSSAITYDPNGNVASRTDFDNHKTCYANDLTRNLETKRVEGLPAGADCTTSLATPPAPTTANPVRTITTTWHPDWRLEAQRAEAKKLTTWVYNGQPDPFAGNAIAACAPSTALLPDGKPIAVLCKKVEQATTDDTGASGFAATVTGNPRINGWTYNGFGQVLTAKGPRTDVNDTTTYDYYPSTDFTNPAAGHTLGDLWKVTNPAGHVTEYLNYDKNGRPLAIKDPNGLVTTMTYSPRGWLKTRQVGDELTTYDYDAVGQLKKVTAPDGSWIGFDYDPAHRLVATYDNQNNKIAYTLDNAGNRTKEDVTDPMGYLVRTQTRVYDALSRLQNVVQPQ